MAQAMMSRSASAPLLLSLVPSNAASSSDVVCGSSVISFDEVSRLHDHPSSSNPSWRRPRSWQSPPNTTRVSPPGHLGCCTSTLSSSFWSPLKAKSAGDHTFAPPTTCACLSCSVSFACLSSSPACLDHGCGGTSPGSLLRRIVSDNDLPLLKRRQQHGRLSRSCCGSTGGTWPTGVGARGDVRGGGAGAGGGGGGGHSLSFSPCPLQAQVSTSLSPCNLGQGSSFPSHLVARSSGRGVSSIAEYNESVDGDEEWTKSISSPTPAEASRRLAERVPEDAQECIDTAGQQEPGGLVVGGGQDEEGVVYTDKDALPFYTEARQQGEGDCGTGDCVAAVADWSRSWPLPTFSNSFSSGSTGLTGASSFEPPRGRLGDWGAFPDLPSPAFIALPTHLLDAGMQGLGCGADPSPLFSPPPAASSSPAPSFLSSPDSWLLGLKADLTSVYSSEMLEECKALGPVDGDDWRDLDCREPAGCPVSEEEVGTTEEYYSAALKDDPENSLLLRNYARFLVEVRADLPRAEHCLERAILASPADADVLVQYGKLTWDFRHDADRAACYFERAVQAAPEDCYVLAAYASFLWSVETSTAASSSPSLKTEQATSLSSGNSALPLTAV